MGFFLEKTWMWLLLSALLAVLLTWWLVRRSAPAAAPEAAPAPAEGTRPVLTPSRGISLRGVLGGDPEVAAMRAEIEALRVKADAGELLRTEMLSLRVDADRARGLEEEVRLLRLRLEGEDGQVAVLKRRIALLEAEASRVPDLERELARAGRPPSTRTLGQVVQQAAGQGEETLPAPSSNGTATAAPVVAPVAAPVVAPAAAPVAAAVAVADATPDLAAARAVLGVPVRLDDLQLVEGIGPKIESLLHADGIRTWDALAAAGVDRLQAVLEAAGPRYRLHDPGTWPEQARLLARGAWEEFAALTARLTSGR